MSIWYLYETSSEALTASHMTRLHWDAPILVSWVSVDVGYSLGSRYISADMGSDCLGLTLLDPKGGSVVVPTGRPCLRNLR